MVALCQGVECELQRQLLVELGLIQLQWTNGFISINVILCCDPGQDILELRLCPLKKAMPRRTLDVHRDTGWAKDERRFMHALCVERRGRYLILTI